MNREDLLGCLGNRLPGDLVTDLVDNFLSLREDLTTETLGRSSPGKFVETFVQILQYLESGTYEEQPRVDEFLRGLEGRSSCIGDGLRICGARAARAMYSLRSKRSVVHKGQVDPSLFDLRFLHHTAQWIVAELIRTETGVSMEEAGRLVQVVQSPAGGLVEDFGDKRLVVEEMTARDEALVLLHRAYPGAASLADLRRSMNRCAPGTVKNTLRAMWSEKLVEGEPSGYRLTRRGHDRAIGVYRRYV